MEREKWDKGKNDCYKEFEEEKLINSHTLGHNMIQMYENVLQKVP